MAGVTPHRVARSVTWTDLVGAGALTAVVILCVGPGLGLTVVHLLELLGLPVKAHLPAIEHRML